MPLSRAPARSAADIAEEKALPKDDPSLTQDGLVYNNNAIADSVCSNNATYVPLRVN